MNWAEESCCWTKAEENCLSLIQHPTMKNSMMKNSTSLTTKSYYWKAAVQKRRRNSTSYLNRTQNYLPHRSPKTRMKRKKTKTAAVAETSHLTRTMRT